MPRAMIALSMAHASACLPADERPEPGALLVDVARSEPAVEGFVTDDGWTITFERFVTALGGMGVGDGDDCIDYSLSFYDRLYDFTVAESSKLALHYGLGTCRLRYRLGPPSDTVILMAGVTDADRRRMRDPRLDDLFGGGLNDDDGDADGGVGLWVVGRAERAGEVMRFDWSIRTSVALHQCFVADRAPLQVTLRPGVEARQVAEVRPRELFRRTPSRAAPLEFDRYADADADADGRITLDELKLAVLDAEPIVADLADEFPPYVPPIAIQAALAELDLELLLRNVLVPRVIAFEGVKECEFFNELDLAPRDR